MLDGGLGGDLEERTSAAGVPLKESSHASQMFAEVILTQLELSALVQAISFQVVCSRRISWGVPRYVLAGICEAISVDKNAIGITDPLKEGHIIALGYTRGARALCVKNSGATNGDVEANFLKISTLPEYNRLSIQKLNSLQKTFIGSKLVS